MKKNEIKSSETDLKKEKEAELPSTEQPLAEKDEVKEAEIRTQKVQRNAAKKISAHEENAEKGE